jgi:hypothetical protein
MRKKLLTEIGGLAHSQEEQAVVKAQSEVPIGHYDFSNANHKKIIMATLLEWAHMIGIKEPATPEENIMNAKFIITNFSEITISEIRQSINWAVMGKLNVDANPYGKISPIYIAKVLNSYLDKRDVINGILIVRARDLRAKREYEEKWNRPYADKLADHKAFLIKHMQEMKIKRIGDCAGSMVWAFLERSKRLNETMFDNDCMEHAKDKISIYRQTPQFIKEANRMTKVKLQAHLQYMEQCFKRDHLIHKLLDRVNSIENLFVNVPDEIILPIR